MVFRDVIEQQKIAQELSKTSNLEALGVLAGGTAHDFNSLLTSITGSISLAKYDQNLTEDVLELLDMPKSLDTFQYLKVCKSTELR